MSLLKTGNLTNEKSLSDQRGWLIGSFAKPPFDSETFEFKWGVHKRGEVKTSPKNDSVAKSLGILISGRLVLTFPEHGKYTLATQGDYVTWERGLEHTLEVLEDSLILTLRWEDQAK